jgi:hypothetical protein
MNPIQPHADRIASAVDRPIVAAWQAILDILSDSQGPAKDYKRALRVLQDLPYAASETLGQQLFRMYRYAHKQAAEKVVGSLTVQGLQKLTGARFRAPVKEDLQIDPRHAILDAFRRLHAAKERTGVGNPNFLSLVHLRKEAGLSREVFDKAIDQLRRQGTLMLSAAEGRHGISDEEREAGIKEEGSLLLFVQAPSGIESLPKSPPIGGLSGIAAPKTREDWEQFVFDTIFPPPSEETVWRALRPLMEPTSDLGDHERKLPEQIASLLAQGTATGKGQREIAKDLLPYFEGSRVRARRAARTFGVHIASVAQEEAYHGLGEHLIGYQAHSVCGKDTRPWHCARNGVIYYRNPRPGQKGMSQCPHPPLEPDDPAERPPKAPKVAFNCMCWLTAVLKGL